MRLAPQSQSLHQFVGGDVVGIAAGVDTMEAEGREAIRYDGVGSFGDVPLPLIARVEHIAEFRLLVP